jgi:hypothetical protein
LNIKKRNCSWHLFVGLAICKEFIEAMGGNIWVKSALGEGAHLVSTLLLFKNRVCNFRISVSEDNIKNQVAKKPPIHF